MVRSRCPRGYQTFLVPHCFNARVEFRLLLPSVNFVRKGQAALLALIINCCVFCIVFLDATLPLVRFQVTSKGFKISNALNQGHSFFRIPEFMNFYSANFNGRIYQSMVPQIHTTKDQRSVGVEKQQRILCRIYMRTYICIFTV